MYLSEDSTNCHDSQKHSRSSNQMISSSYSWIPDKAITTHIEFGKIGVRTFATTFTHFDCDRGMDDDEMKEFSQERADKESITTKDH